ncbi:Ku protein [Zhihengliuella sp.]|uniref:non-homologous end joining protein Ku n=1 Tax=Zhihengliuella sp. TaxID=1954483 RepID=UPI002811369A|nr:Ku protein [Zhihengliuella sp.]
MRAIWTGAVAFGLVNVPVKVYGATTDHDIRLHQVHDADGGRIRYERRCEVCGKKVEYEDIDKAYDDGDRTVVLSDEDIESLPAEKSDEIDVVQFVPSDQIDPLLMDKSYYLEPMSKSPKAYILLRRTLEASDLTAIVRFSLRRRTNLGALRVRDKVLILQQLRWADELREVDFPATQSKAKVSDQELKMAAALVDQFSGDFTPEDYVDEYQEELQVLIEEKLEKGDALDTDATFGDAEAAREEAETDRGNVVDLMEALKRSVETKRGGGSQRTSAADADDDESDDDTDADADADEKSESSRKSASSKSGSKTKASGSKSSGSKSSAKKSTAKSGTAKKSSAAKKSGTAKKSSAAKKSGTAKKSSGSSGRSSSDSSKKTTKKSA